MEASRAIAAYWPRSTEDLVCMYKVLQSTTSEVDDMRLIHDQCAEPNAG